MRLSISSSCLKGLDNMQGTKNKQQTRTQRCASYDTGVRQRSLISASKPIPPERSFDLNRNATRTLQRSAPSMVLATSTPSHSPSLSSIYDGPWSDPNTWFSDNSITQRDVLIVSENVTQWQTVFRYLYEHEETGTVIEQLESNYRYAKVQEKCAKALEEWKKRSGNEAQLQTLVNALVRVGRKDVVDKLSHAHGRPLTSRSISSFPSSLSTSFSSIAQCDFRGFCFENNVEERQFERLPREVERIKDALKDPFVTVISLAGPQKSGKTVTLNILEKEIEREMDVFHMVKVIKIQSTNKIDKFWLSSKIVEEIQKEKHIEKDQSSHAIKDLVGLLQTYDSVILLLDISLNSTSLDGKGIIDELLTLRKSELLSKQVKIVVSTITSLWKTSLFLQDRKAFKEITVQPFDYKGAIEYIREINPSFSSQVAEAIVKKIDCYPFYLRQIADADIYTIFVADGKEELIRSIETKFEELNELLFDPDVEQAVSSVFESLDVEKKALLTQVLTFAHSFGLEQAQRILDHKFEVDDCLFNSLCEQGALFLKRERAKAKVINYRIPKIQGDILRMIVSKRDQFTEMYHKALTRHQKLYLELLVLLSDCFMGEIPIKSEELRVLEPFTPSDGVPAGQSLTIQDANERVSRAVEYFRKQHDDIIKSLLYCTYTRENYQAVVDVITKLNVYYFLTYMLCPHKSLKIYRKLKREAKIQQDHKSLVKLNVFIASFRSDANGYNKYLPEANSLYEASESSLEGITHAHCIQRIGTNLLAEGVRCSKDQELIRIGGEKIRKARHIFQENDQQMHAKQVYVSDCNRLLAGMFYELGMENGEYETDLDKAISTFSSILGSRHPLACSSRLIKSMILKRRREFRSAKKILYEIQDAEEDLLGQHWQTSKTLYALALCLYEEMKHSSGICTAETSIDNQSSQDQFIFEDLSLHGMESASEITGSEYKGSEQTRNQPSTFNQQNHVFILGNEDDKELANSCWKKECDLEKIEMASEVKEIVGGKESTKTLLMNVKNLLKKSGKYALLANGNCKDAYDCMRQLSEISRELGEEEAAKRYQAKARKVYGALE